jgi:hypothetical protein
MAARKKKIEVIALETLGISIQTGLSILNHEEPTKR